MLEARLWIKKSDKNFLGRGRIELLERIKHHGSIHAAAKAMKMSYKAAWDSVDAMNNLSDEPLVQKTSGGKGGGGTLLTAKGEEIIQAFHTLEQIHRQFLDLFSDSEDLSTIVKALSRLSLKLSARNQLKGTIVAVEEGAVNGIVKIEVAPGVVVSSSITNSSIEVLGLAVGGTAYAVIKASSVMVGIED
ncbi:TOBE domain-containing protein [Sulfurospirillum cavolei]|uniref:TOBE domain-containing protein n=1 Tax=Sulfurospirillum cavolei TaxID=366522 RepID=UPI003FA1F12F